ncbi:MAG: hypothetical protein KAS32_31205 [Candidatus Peribacteraceae bacterium]|nr:hypothetical protein [Candidatus Peribacteraceae bacterium]
MKLTKVIQATGKNGTFTCRVVVSDETKFIKNGCFSVMTVFDNGGSSGATNIPKSNLLELVNEHIKDATTWATYRASGTGDDILDEAIVGLIDLGFERDVEFTYKTPTLRAVEQIKDSPEELL